MSIFFHSTRSKILCALALLVFAVGVIPVAAQTTEADLVPICHNGRSIQVHPMAALLHVVLHGDIPTVCPPWISNTTTVATVWW